MSTFLSKLYFQALALLCLNGEKVKSPKREESGLLALPPVEVSVHPAAGPHSSSSSSSSSSRRKRGLLGCTDTCPLSRAIAGLSAAFLVIIIIIALSRRRSKSSSSKAALQQPAAAAAAAAAAQQQQQQQNAVDDAAASWYFQPPKHWREIEKATTESEGWAAALADSNN
ncbi:hypothetical protein, conserved [Eimeria necatrix]|uniref:Uncharacterized protein n=1 Tax=Eimeria necatrix TaxID=51315 RepID=U6N1V6_9EIME|nr:hypothetical protein, conserved [Eimeria necatrix]CDJ70187.1 hypothetical protein, conserved [Eimeria necatrix]